MPIVSAYVAIVIGFIVLIWSADRFVGGSAAVAKNMGVSKLMIGLTIVAFGTSAPEILVSIISALKGSGDLAVGNALGSNLANIGLVLGITAIIAPIKIKGYILKQEYLLMLAVIFVSGLFLADAYLTSWEGYLLVGLLIPLLIWIIRIKKHHPDDEENEEIPKYSNTIAVFWLLVGLIFLVGSAQVLVWAAQIIATHFGVSSLIIGLTVVAIGTSLPELAASVMSALKNHHDIALGNIIGSNVFNLLLVMGIAPAISPVTIEPMAFSRDYLSMAGLSITLGIFMAFSYWIGNKDNAYLGRWMGAILLCLYVAYYFVLFR